MNSNSLQEVANKYQQCMQISVDALSRRWLPINISPEKLHDNCLQLAISIQDCVETCKLKVDWQDQKECFQTCAKYK